MQLVAFGQPLSARQGYAPVPTGTEVVLRVLGAGVCHSDVHLWEGFHDHGGGRRATFEARIGLPLTLGHETAGEVFAIGPDVAAAEGAVAPGDRCLLCSWIGCGACEACAAGDENLCTAPRYRGVNRDGGYADFVVVPHPRYLIPLGDLDPVAAAPLACSGLTAFCALRKARSDQHRVVVIGAGGLGLMAVGLSRLLGDPAVIVVEPDAARRQAALEAGALAAIDPREGQALDRVRSAAGGPVRAVVDFVGGTDTTLLGFDLLAKGGTLVIVGLFGGALSVPIPMLASKAVTIQGSYIGRLDELRELVTLLRERGLPPMPLSRRPLADAGAAIQALRDGRGVGRTVLVP